MSLPPYYMTLVKLDVCIVHVHINNCSFPFDQRDYFDFTLESWSRWILKYIPLDQRQLTWEWPRRWSTWWKWSSCRRGDLLIPGEHHRTIINTKVKNATDWDQNIVSNMSNVHQSKLICTRLIDEVYLKVFLCTAGSSKCISMH